MQHKTRERREQSTRPGRAGAASSLLTLALAGVLPPGMAAASPADDPYLTPFTPCPHASY
jgi:hypothetical protein